eukprot:GDKH01024619.1.p1 GENE.GDKH01024619.1~~GDKH01024619.1.p1  ORF type:complete len:287 (-),score=7.24 GDKH01024619.1:106-966(-)
MEVPAAAIADFRQHGFTVLRSFLDDSAVQGLCTAAESYRPEESLRHQYCQKDDPKRFEYMLEDSEYRSGTDGERLAGQQINSRLLGAVHQFEQSLEPASSFCIVSEPGSRHQENHTDSVPSDELPLETWRNTVHYIGCLTPLVNTTPECGLTAVFPGSHSNHSGLVISKPEVRVALERGDVLVLDGRTIHRGLGNDSTSDVVRQMCFFTFKPHHLTDGNAAAYSGPVQNKHENTETPRKGAEKPHTVHASKNLKRKPSSLLWGVSGKKARLLRPRSHGGEQSKLDN